MPELSAVGKCLLCRRVVGGSTVNCFQALYCGVPSLINITNDACECLDGGDRVNVRNRPSKQKSNGGMGVGLGLGPASCRRPPRLRLLSRGRIQPCRCRRRVLSDSHLHRHPKIQTRPSHLTAISTTRLAERSTRRVFEAAFRRITAGGYCSGSVRLKVRSVRQLRRRCFCE